MCLQLKGIDFTWIVYDFDRGRKFRKLNMEH